MHHKKYLYLIELKGLPRYKNMNNLFEIKVLLRRAKCYEIKNEMYIITYKIVRILPIQVVLLGLPLKYNSGSFP